MRKFLLAIPLLIAGCAQPKTVSRSDLQGLQAHQHEPKISMWYYTGSRDGYHYFHHDDLGSDPKDFRVVESELALTNTFPMTHDRKKWRRLDPEGTNQAQPQPARAEQPPQVFYVDGEFQHPGVYPWTNGVTLQDAIAVGGFTPFSRKYIRIHHWDGSVEKYKWSTTRPLTNNPVLRPGDAVQIPRD